MDVQVLGLNIEEFIAMQNIFFIVLGSFCWYSWAVEHHLTRPRHDISTSAHTQTECWGQQGAMNARFGWSQRSDRPWRTLANCSPTSCLKDGKCATALCQIRCPLVTCLWQRESKLKIRWSKRPEFFFRYRFMASHLPELLVSPAAGQNFWQTARKAANVHRLPKPM